MALPTQRMRVAKRDGRHHPRKASLEKQAMDDLPPLDRSLVGSADAFLDEQKELSRALDNFLQDPVGSLENSVDIVSKATNKQHIKAVAFAYSLWLKSSTNPSYRKLIEKAWQRRSKLDKRTTPLHLLVESVVLYGDGTKKSRSDNRGLYNRDVCAIRYLHFRKIGPNEVEDYQSNGNGGLRAWSDAWTDLKRGRAANQAHRQETPKAEKFIVSITSNTSQANLKIEKFVFIFDEKNKEFLPILKNLLQSLKDWQSSTSN